MKKIFIALLIFSVLNNSTVFARSKEENAVAAAVETLRKAMVNGDSTALLNLAADGLSYGHSSGQVQNKAEFVSAIASGKSDFVSINLTNQTIYIHDNIAVVRHSFLASTNDGGKPGTAKLAVLLIWQKQGGRWKLLARQAVKVV